jgi:hypothetical protein
MAQNLFDNDNTGSAAELDANFTELYSKVAWSTTGIGYATGSGGSETQLTSKSTGVTLNKTNGRITMHAASLASATSVSFTLTNSLIAANDAVVATIASGATAGAYTLAADSVSAGSCRISLRNHTGGALAEAVVFNFAVVKVVTS